MSSSSTVSDARAAPNLRLPVPTPSPPSPLAVATTGRTVVRLKGGDPTVFGRGGEEMEYLDSQGVDVQIVPGITAASGISAQLGVPLTHRDFADSVRFITGHARSECSAPVEERYPWSQLADPKTTLVIYMGLSTLPELTAGLLAAGLGQQTPAVAVQDGTTATQRVVAAPIGELAAAVEAAELRSPTLVIIGSVVSLIDPVAAASDANAVSLCAADVLRTVGHVGITRGAVLPTRAHPVSETPEIGP